MSATIRAACAAMKNMSCQVCWLIFLPTYSLAATKVCIDDQYTIDGCWGNDGFGGFEDARDDALLLRVRLRGLIQVRQEPDVARSRWGGVSSNSMSGRARGRVLDRQEQEAGVRKCIPGPTG
jgi:hypothetical protein